jgi:hypothetical protein
VVLDYAKAGGVWSLQPFFDERVCYIYPVPGGGGSQETFEQALQDVWWVAQPGRLGRTARPAEQLRYM